MKDKDIRDLAESYGRRTARQGWMLYFWHASHSILESASFNWVQDFKQISDTPNLASFANDPVAFRNTPDDAQTGLRCARSRRTSRTLFSKAADPGKFEDERKWPEWEPAFELFVDNPRCEWCTTVLRSPG
jgi:hypothetical protein